MTVRKPAVIDGGNIRQLREGDTIPLTAVNNLQARLSDLERQLVRQSATMYFDFKRDKYIIRDPYTLDVVDIGFGLLDFSRSTTGTNWGNSPSVQLTPIDTPRFQIDPISKLRLGVLLEQAETNILVGSEDLSTWNINVGVSLSANIYPAPDGTTTMDGLLALPDGSNDRRAAVAKNAGTSVVGDIFILSGFFRVGMGCDVIALGANQSGARFGWAAYNTVTGASTVYLVSTIGTFSLLNALEIEPDLWFLSVKFTSGISGNFNPLIHFGNGGASDLRFNPPQAGQVGFWGADVKKSNCLSTYIKTVSAATTRAADFLSRTLGSEYNPDEGTLRLTTKARTGDTVLTLGSTSIVATSNELETYTLTYNSDPGATELVFGPGIHESLFYYPEII